METAIEDGTAVRELSAQHIGTGVVQSNGLSNEKEGLEREQVAGDER